MSARRARGRSTRRRANEQKGASAARGRRRGGVVAAVPPEDRARPRRGVLRPGGEASTRASEAPSARRYSRSIGNSAGTTDRYFFDAQGKKFRSKAEIARALGLAKAPAVRHKGDGTSRNLKPGEAPAVVSFNWDKLVEPGAAPLEKTFENSAKALDVAGDFLEYNPHSSLEERLQTPRLPRKWREILENASATGVRENRLSSGRRGARRGSSFDASRRRRGDDVDIPRTSRRRRGYDADRPSMHRGDAATT